MPKMGIIVMVVLIGAAVAYAVWSTRTSFVIRAEREIEASADEVWNVLVDRESYPRWNPFVVSSTGPLTEGATITNVLSDVHTDGADGVEESRISLEGKVLDHGSVRR